MAKMEKKAFADAMRLFAETVIQSQADDKCVDERGWSFSYDTYAMVKAVDKLIADGFDREPVLA